MSPPVIDHGRIRRLTQSLEPNKERSMNFATQMCLVVIFLMGLYLFKRFKDKQQSRTQHILQQ